MGPQREFKGGPKANGLAHAVRSDGADFDAGFTAPAFVPYGGDGEPMTGLRRSGEAGAHRVSRHTLVRLTAQNLTKASD